MNNRWLVVLMVVCWVGCRPKIDDSVVLPSKPKDARLQTPKAGPDSFAQDVCGQCADEQCSSAVGACESDPGCAVFRGCLWACSTDDEGHPQLSCAVECGTSDNKATQLLVSELLQCVQDIDCGCALDASSPNLNSLEDAHVAPPNETQVRPSPEPPLAPNADADASVTTAPQEHSAEVLDAHVPLVTEPVSEPTLADAGPPGVSVDPAPTTAPTDPTTAPTDPTTAPTDPTTAPTDPTVPTPLPDLDPGACVPNLPGNLCNECMWTECCQLGAACDQHAQCMDFIDCWDACPDGDALCLEECEATFPDGVDPANRFLWCTTAQCAAPCELQSPCVLCSSQKCGAESLACVEDEACWGIISCMQECTTEECQLDCQSNNLAGYLLYNDLTYCGVFECAAECSQ